MAASLQLTDLLSETAKRLATLNHIQAERLQAAQAEWKDALGAYLDSPGALYSLVQSPDYWNAVKMPPIVLIIFKEVALDAACRNSHAFTPPATVVDTVSKRRRSSVEEISSTGDEKKPSSTSDKKKSKKEKQYFNVTDICRIYGGRAITFGWQNGKVTRALIQQKHHPKAPQELWLTDPKNFEINMTFPIFLWEAYGRWEYVGNWKVKEIVLNDSSIPSEFAAKHSLRLELESFALPR